MVKLDRVLIKTEASYITLVEDEKIIDEKIKDKVIYIYNKKDEILKIRYEQDIPFKLIIDLDIPNNKAIIEFSAKILKDDYPKLITYHTIHQCFYNICLIGIFKLEVNKILSSCMLYSCDVTNDIDGIILPTDFKPILIANLNNISKYHIQRYNGGYTITKDVTTPWRKVRLTIYNKGKEITKATNKPFLNELKHANELVEYFADKYRIETNLKTFKQIRNYFNTNDLTLMNILKSESNPLAEIFDIVFELDKHGVKQEENVMQSIYDYDRIKDVYVALLLRECNYDLSNVLNLLKCCSKDDKNWSRRMKPFKEFVNKLPEQNHNRRMLSTIRSKLIA